MESMLNKKGHKPKGKADRKKGQVGAWVGLRISGVDTQGRRAGRKRCDCQGEKVLKTPEEILRWEEVNTSLEAKNPRI